MSVILIRKLGLNAYQDLHDIEMILPLITPTIFDQFRKGKISLPKLKAKALSESGNVKLVSDEELIEYGIAKEYFRPPSP